jgi:hypothetical protein
VNLFGKLTDGLIRRPRGRRTGSSAAAMAGAALIAGAEGRRRSQAPRLDRVLERRTQIHRCPYICQYFQ